MSAVASTAGIICIIAVSSSIVTLIAPQGSSKRVLTAVVGVFILCCLIVPVKKAFFNSDIKIDIPKYSGKLTASADEAYEKALLAETKSELESGMTAYLLNKGYKVKSARVTLNSEYKAGIYIESIVIYISKSELNRSADIVRIISGKYETKPKLRIV